MNYLPNPKKEAQCNFPIEKVKQAINSLPSHTKAAEVLFASDTMGFYKFSCKGQTLFSLGMILDVALHADGEYTTIQLECRRSVGAIDRPIELHECIEFMVGTFSLLGKVLDGTVGK